MTYEVKNAQAQFGSSGTFGQKIASDSREAYEQSQSYLETFERDLHPFNFDIFPEGTDMMIFEDYNPPMVVDSASDEKYRKEKMKIKSIFQEKGFDGYSIEELRMIDMNH